MAKNKRKLATCKLVTVHELIKSGKEKLQACDNDNPHIESEILALHVLGYTKLERILNSRSVVSKDEQDLYNDYIDKRCSGIPLQYITNEQEFMGLPFYVDSNVLIPRQDTETLVEILINKIKENSYKKIIEIGSGSGCISISLAKFINDIDITAIDISEKALEVALRNARKNHVEERIKWLKGDLLSDYPSDKQVDLIVSNPPYIATDDCRKLDYQIRGHEPLLALDGGEDGLDYYREITKQSISHLTKGGMLAYEIGYNQSEYVYDIMKANGFSQLEQIKDLAGKDRIVLGVLNDKVEK